MCESIIDVSKLRTRQAAYLLPWKIKVFCSSGFSWISDLLIASISTSSSALLRRSELELTLNELCRFLSLSLSGPAYYIPPTNCLLLLKWVFKLVAFIEHVFFNKLLWSALVHSSALIYTD